MTHTSPSPWTRLAVFLALLTLMGACKTTSADPVERAVSPGNHEPNLRLPAMPLASLAHPKGCVRIAISDTLETDGFTLPLVGRRVPEASKRGFLVPQLFEALGAHPLKRSRCVALRADGRTPYRTVVEVLYSAGQARYDVFWMVTQGLNGAAAIESKLPKITVARPDAPLHSGRCLRALGRVSARGTRIDIAPGSDHATAETAEPRKPATSDALRSKHPSANILDHLLNAPKEDIEAALGSGKKPDTEGEAAAPAPSTSSGASSEPVVESDSHPSTVIDLRDGAQDFAAIRDWLAAQHGDESCETGIVSAPDTLTWDDVCTVLAAFSTTGTLPILGVQ